MEAIFGFIFGLIGTIIVGGIIVLAIAVVGWLILKILEWIFFDVFNI